MCVGAQRAPTVRPPCAHRANQLFSWHSTFGFFTHQMDKNPNVSTDSQFKSIAQWQYTAQWKVHYCFYHVAQGNDVKLTKGTRCRRAKGKAWSWHEYLNDLRQTGGALQRQPVGHQYPCVLLFGHIYTLFNDTCHWTDQKHVSSGWKIERKAKRANVQWSRYGSLWAKPRLVCLGGTKRFSRST